jgi:hemolysin III
VNGWLHLGAALVAAAGLAVLVVEARARHSMRHLLGAAVFGTTAVLLFGASANYHLRATSRRTALYRRLDHAMIYLLIAGTYTPLCLVPLWPTRTGRVLLAVVWALAIAGVVVEVVLRELPRRVSTTIYLALGWAGVLATPVLVNHLPWALLVWVLLGGLLYTLGAAVYWRKWPRGRPGVFGFHELWHVFVIAASASHYWAVLRYVLPLG